MNKQECIAFFNSVHPNFFERKDIRELTDECIFDEMVLPLKEFDFNKYNKTFDSSVSFGFYNGTSDELKKLVAKVEPSWVEFFGDTSRVYCGYINGEPASFCKVEDNGSHIINGQKIKVGGPGCVGTVPEYRNKGIGITMVKKVTQILKDEGFDYGYIHYTGVAPWYGKLGYKTYIRWNKNSIVF